MVDIYLGLVLVKANVNKKLAGTGWGAAPACSVKTVAAVAPTLRVSSSALP
jgi:hypothetical protein